jgi:hypothetical protein
VKDSESLDEKVERVYMHLLHKSSWTSLEFQPAINHRITSKFSLLTKDDAMMPRNRERCKELSLRYEEEKLG